MATKDRKIRKMRGSKTCGYGSKKKHRGKGSKGGKGYAGSHKHKWTYIVKYEPDHFGKHGFTPVKRKEAKTINVGELEELLKKNSLEKNEIDLTELGYEKLLGKGKVTKPFIIKVKEFSEIAKRKIESAGGKIIKE
jgi:large subunit ribosomal protein L15